MKPLIHAKLSVTKYGGNIEDYLSIHEWFDKSKQIIPDMRHRMMYHHSFGIYMSVDFFGDYFTNSEGRDIATRDIGEEHILQDLGFIPTLQDYFDGLDGEPAMEIRNWYGGLPKSIRKVSLVD